MLAGPRTAVHHQPESHRHEQDSSVSQRRPGHRPSDTAGQREVLARQPEAGKSRNCTRPPLRRDCLTISWMTAPLARRQAAARRLAEDVYCWSGRRHGSSRLSRARSQPDPSPDVSHSKDPFAHAVFLETRRPRRVFRRRTRRWRRGSMLLSVRIVHVCDDSSLEGAGPSAPNVRTALRDQRPPPLVAAYRRGLKLAG